eukprot:gene17745-21161_t
MLNSKQLADLQHYFDLLPKETWHHMKSVPDLSSYKTFNAGQIRSISHLLRIGLSEAVLDSMESYKYILDVLLYHDIYLGILSEKEWDTDKGEYLEMIVKLHHKKYLDLMSEKIGKANLKIQKYNNNTKNLSKKKLKKLQRFINFHQTLHYLEDIRLYGNIFSNCVELDEKMHQEPKAVVRTSYNYKKPEKNLLKKPAFKLNWNLNMVFKYDAHRIGEYYDISLKGNLKSATIVKRIEEHLGQYEHYTSNGSHTTEKGCDASCFVLKNRDQEYLVHLHKKLNAGDGTLATKIIDLVTTGLTLKAFLRLFKHFSNNEIFTYFSKRYIFKKEYESLCIHLMHWINDNEQLEVYGNEIISEISMQDIERIRQVIISAEAISNTPPDFNNGIISKTTVATAPIDPVNDNDNPKITLATAPIDPVSDNDIPEITVATAPTDPVKDTGIHKTTVATAPTDPVKDTDIHKITVATAPTDPVKDTGIPKTTLATTPVDGYDDTNEEEDNLEYIQEHTIME